LKFTSVFMNLYFIRDTYKRFENEKNVFPIFECNEKI